MKLTRRRAHPVGKKARTAANKSDIVRPYALAKTIVMAKEARKRNALSILNASRSSMPSIRLPTDKI